LNLILTNLLPRDHLLGVFILANLPTLTNVNLIITDTQRDFGTEESTK
jgi:hypothetical protein